MGVAAILEHTFVQSFFGSEWEDFKKGGGVHYVPTHQFSSSFAWLIPSMYQL